MVVHYPLTAWKNSYAEHNVTGKTYDVSLIVPQAGDVCEDLRLLLEGYVAQFTAVVEETLSERLVLDDVVKAYREGVLSLIWHLEINSYP